MISIRRKEALGDVLWVEPIVRHFIGAGEAVNLLTDYPELFDHYPSDQLYLNHPCQGDLIDLDGAYEMRPNMHFLEAYRIAAAIKEMPLSYPRLYLSTQEKEHVWSEKKYALLHLARNPLHYRNVYGIDWNRVIAHLDGLGYEVLQIAQLPRDIYGKWAPTETLRELISLINGASLFIGLDSGPSHIAASLGIPSLLFFGSVNPHFRHLPSFKGHFLQGGCEYAHCYHEGKGVFGKPCRLVPPNQPPKCCMHTTEKVNNFLNDIHSSLIYK